MTVEFNPTQSLSFFQEALNKEIISNEYLAVQRIELQKLIVMLGSLAFNATMIALAETEQDCREALQQK